MTNNILYINSAVRAESRTNELAKYLLEKLEGNITELKLEDENLKPLNGKSLAERDFIIGSNNKDNEMLKYATGSDILNPQALREGVVIRSQAGIKSFKAVSISGAYVPQYIGLIIYITS